MLRQSPLLQNDGELVAWFKGSGRTPTDAVLRIAPNSFPTIAVAELQAGLIIDILFIDADLIENVQARTKIMLLQNEGPNDNDTTNADKADH